MLTNPLVLKQMAAVVLGSGLTMAFLLTFIFAATGEFQDIPAMLLVSLITTVVLGLCMLLIAAVLFGNRFRVRFTVDADGVLWETVDTRAKTAGRLAMVAGVLGRSPQTAGAGLCAVAQKKSRVRWRELSFAEYDRRRRMITLRNSWRPVMMVVCLPGDFDKVTGLIREKVTEFDGTSKGQRNPLWKGLLRTLFVSLAAAPSFTLSNYPIELNLFVPLTMFAFALAMVWLMPLFGWVVIACAAMLAVQITWIGWSEFADLYVHEQIVFLLAYAGLAYLAWFSRQALRGKVVSPLMQQ